MKDNTEKKFEGKKKNTSLQETTTTAGSETVPSIQDGPAAELARTQETITTTETTTENVVEEPEERAEVPSGFQDVTKTGKIGKAVTPEMIRLEGSQVALLGEVGPGLIIGPGLFMIFKTHTACLDYISRGAAFIEDPSVDGDIVSAILILLSSFQKQE